jgi:hypothetical protein
MPGGTLLHSDLIRNSGWLAHHCDETNDAIQFRLVPREVQRKIKLLTDAGR